MQKYRIAFVAGVVVGLAAISALLTGGDMWFVILLICSSTILTTVGPPIAGSEQLRENWHFSLAVLLAVVGIVIGIVAARGPLFGAVTGASQATAVSAIPMWLRVTLSSGWLALTVYRARKAWQHPVAAV